MANTLGPVTINFLAKTGGFEKGVSTVERKTKRATRNAERDVKRMSASIGRSLRRVAMAGTAAFAAIALGTGKAIQNMADLQDSADALGVSAEKYSRLAFAAKSVGVESSRLDNALGKLNRRMANAASGSAQQAQMFAKLGISIVDANGHARSSIDVLKDLAAQYQRTGATTDFVTVATQLFGNQWRDIVPLLSGGKGAIEKLERQADKLGATITDKAGKAAQDFDLTLGQLKQAFQGVFTLVAQDLLPELNKLADDLLNNAKAHDAVKKAADSVVATLRFATDHWRAIAGVVGGIVAQKLFFSVAGGIMKVVTACRVLGSLRVAALLLNPIALAATAVAAALGGTAMAIYEYSHQLGPAEKSSREFEKALKGINDQMDVAPEKARADARALKEHTRATIQAAQAELQRMQVRAQAYREEQARRRDRGRMPGQRADQVGGYAAGGAAAQMDKNIATQQKYIKEKQRELEELQKAIDAPAPALPSGSAAPSAGAVAPPGGGTTAANDLRSLADNIAAMQDKLGQSAQAAADKAMSATGAQAQNDLSLIQSLQTPMEAAQARFEDLQRKIAASNLPDTIKEKLNARAFDEWRAALQQAGQDTQTTFGKMNQFAIQASRNMQTSLADFFMDPTKRGFEGLLDSFVNMLKRMAAELLASKVLGMMQGSGGFGGGGGGGIMSMFAASQGGGGGGGGGWMQLAMMAAQAFLADGGPTSAGRPYIVGERGPELFVPNSSGSVVPHHALGGGGNVYLTVENNGSEKTGQITQSTDGSGNKFIKLILKQVDDRMTQNAANPSSQFRKALGATTNLQRRGIPVGG